MKKLVFILSVLLSTPIMAEDFCNSNIGRTYVQNLSQFIGVPNNMAGITSTVTKISCQNNILTYDYRVDVTLSKQERKKMADNIQDIDIKQFLCSTKEIQEISKHGLQEVVYNYVDNKEIYITTKKIPLNCQ